MGEAARSRSCQNLAQVCAGQGVHLPGLGLDRDLLGVEGGQPAGGDVWVQLVGGACVDGDEVAKEASQLQQQIAASVSWPLQCLREVTTVL